MVEIEPNRALQQKRISDLFAWAICAVFAAFASAVLVTWQLVARNPVLEEEGYALGLLVFFFIVLFDLFLLPPLALTRARESNAGTAALWSLKFFLGGLLAAAGLVLSGGLFFRFVSEHPQVASFLKSAGDVAILLCLVMQVVLLFRRRHAGKAGAGGNGVGPQ